MQEYGLIITLAMGFSIALVLGYFTHKLGLSPILGYLLAGIIIAPTTPGPVGNIHMAEQLAEVGVILLMFGVGIHFNLKDLWAVRWIALPGAVIQSLAATVLGALAVRLFNWSWLEGIVFGIALSVASTVVLMRILSDNNKVDSPHGHIAIGWLIVEDIFTVLVLVILPGLALSTKALTFDVTGTLFSLLVALLKIIILGVVVLIIGGKVLPWVLRKVAQTHSRELFTLTVLTIALIIATLSALVFGASVALGAFLAGMVVGQTNMSQQAGADALPMKDAFAVLFFIATGMLFDPMQILANPGLFAVAVGVILIVKPAVSFILVSGLGYTSAAAFTVAAGLSQIGEFSFILAGEARKLGILPPEAVSVIVAAAIFTISINPVLFKLSITLEKLVKKNPKLWKLLNWKAENKIRLMNVKINAALESDNAVRAIVVGYGPVGQTLTHILQDFKIKPVIIEYNIDTVIRINQTSDIAVIFGDAAKSDILKTAGIEKAKYLIVTLPEITARLPVILTARNLNKDLKIFSRARYIKERVMLEEFGVTEVCYEEAEAAVGLSKLLLNTEGVDGLKIEERTKQIREELAINTD